MKLSISLTESDVAALDEYIREAGLPSRSAGIQRALHLLSHESLEQDYESAWQEWEASDDRIAWEHVTSDGLA